MLATVRNRSGVVATVEPFDGDNGRLHLVHVEYKDSRSPGEERVLWELEPGRSLLEPTALPDPTKADAMPPEDFDALLRAARWTALSPYLGPDGQGPPRHEPLASPFHGAVRPEDYQLVPLLKALRMPRVSLLIADDVGLGKTIEAGLILTELLLRRRIRRVLVLAPAALRWQWRDELWEKFSLRFEVVDRHRTDRTRRRLGMDANPWRSFDRIVASYHYLPQPDVREQFLSACHTPEGSPHLPWDLLIVDECHNLMPSPFGEDSELCRTLRLVAPRFEHRLFLSATPHNGHTRSFTGLLEMLDPVRFTRTAEMTDAMRRRADDVVIRRLKREINAGSSAPRFCRRNPPRSLRLEFDPRESALSTAFDAFRRAVRRLVADGTTRRRRAGTFAVEILGKRLLSCSTAFAESWRRARQGYAKQEAAQEQDLNFAGEVSDEMVGLDRALDALGFDLEGAPAAEQTPVVDVRFDTLIALIERLLRHGDEFRDDERLIVFTEYKTTLDYLARRLRERYPADRVLTLFGAGGPEGMTDLDRDNVKAAFNDPESSVRVLVATDAASEGLNLHRTARYLLHYECPWNPSRLEQRNGRLDRLARGHRRRRTPPRARRRHGSDATTGIQHRSLHRAAWPAERIPAPSRCRAHAPGASADAARAQRPGAPPLSRRPPGLTLDRASRRRAGRRRRRSPRQRYAGSPSPGRSATGRRDHGRGRSGRAALAATPQRRSHSLLARAAQCRPRCCATAGGRTLPATPGRGAGAHRTLDARAVAGSGLVDRDAERVRSTLRRLHLNSTRFCRVRAEFAEARWSGDITAEYLARHSPFVARELRRQGRMNG